MTAPRLIVGIAELEVARAPATLAALALGSCVAVILHDAEAKIGGMAHVLLPSSSAGRPRPGEPGRFAPSAVAALLEGVLRLGAKQPRLTARLVGGASMFAVLQPPGTIQMGERNVHAARESLHRLGIRLVGELVGGDFGRSVDFDVATGRVVVNSYERGRAEL
ncbi:MAG: chemotaxis protein CheD [Gemmatimonadales bacterium]|nr:chemotaxis protein CheD [Gemmatimonadales bacterium]